uniref:Uncharacterized protein n=1 Tax=Panagrellus redivivus TaxID=6233 RepID=A0A7E4VD45_PANRE
MLWGPRQRAQPPSAATTTAANSPAASTTALPMCLVRVPRANRTLSPCSARPPGASQSFLTRLFRLRPLDPRVRARGRVNDDCIEDLRNPPAAVSGPPFPSSPPAAAAAASTPTAVVAASPTTPQARRLTPLLPSQHRPRPLQVVYVCKAVAPAPAAAVAATDDTTDDDPNDDDNPDDEAEERVVCCE